MLAISHIARTGYVVLSELCNLAAARDGAIGVACLYPRIACNGSSVLVPLPSGVRREVEHIDWLEIIREISFDPVALLVAYCRMLKVYGC